MTRVGWKRLFIYFQGSEGIIIINCGGPLVLHFKGNANLVGRYSVGVGMLSFVLFTFVTLLLLEGNSNGRKWMQRRN